MEPLKVDMQCTKPEYHKLKKLKKELEEKYGAKVEITIGADYGKKERTTD